MITFEEITNTLEAFELIKNHKSYFHEKARYFKITKNNNTICFYGVINHTANICELFLMIKTFNGKVFSKDFFISLFNHVISLGYNEIYTWTRCDRLINILSNFKKFGINQIDCPSWDKDQTKTWFIKRI